MIRLFLTSIVFSLLAIVYFPYINFYDIQKLEARMTEQENQVPSIDKLENYLKEKESSFVHLRKGLEKAITWHDENKKEKTEFSFIYLPGFTATKKEISPVVETLSKRFKANSFFSRLPSHGEEADDYSNARTEQFFESAIEAVEIGHRIGHKPVFVGLSTGAALLQYVLNRSKNAFAFVAFSPAFYSSWHIMNVSLNPWIGHSLVKLLMGDYYEWKHQFPKQDLYWNTKYNTDILPEITRVFQITSRQEYSQMNTPYLLIFNEQDNVIDHTQMLKKWGQTKNPFNDKISLQSRDRHVVSGEITSPETTDQVISSISTWLSKL